MARASTFFVVLLLLFSLSSAARRTPTANERVDATDKVVTEGTQVEDSCNGITENECLMRRTLNAHLDYIYTQQHNP
ncbi:hypothetical protein SASPL_144860 [Salvia splendens]|uniref:Phytosulfokine n=1 Tax=Salvia splendens TaxID=180675 RepID=A0A8X8WHZ4_SALSN|nr:phytosulfokines 3-like [Salvia splendens]XP_042044827.1 phytosulfokines 3-like [Salvia splendens]KAG6394276.1 hypothetical protein SASPL_144860 [Salvia splendens]